RARTWLPRVSSGSFTGADRSQRNSSPTGLTPDFGVQASFPRESSHRHRLGVVVRVAFRSRTDAFLQTSHRSSSLKTNGTAPRRYWEGPPLTRHHGPEPRRRRPNLRDRVR